MAQPNKTRWLKKRTTLRYETAMHSQETTPDTAMSKTLRLTPLTQMALVTAASGQQLKGK